MKSLTKHTWATYFQQGSGRLYGLHSWHKSTCFFCGLTVFFCALVNIYAIMSVCVCVYMQRRLCCVDVRVLRTHGPGLSSHDCKRSQGRNHAALRQLSHHSLFHRAAPVPALPAQRSRIALPGTHPHSRLLPLFLS